MRDSLKLLEQWTLGTVGIDTRVLIEYIKVTKMLTDRTEAKINTLKGELQDSIKREYRDPRHEMGQ